MEGNNENIIDCPLETIHMRQLNIKTIRYEQILCDTNNTNIGITCRQYYWKLIIIIMRVVIIIIIVIMIIILDQVYDKSLIL